MRTSSSPERLRALWSRNSVTIEMLRANLRDLKTEAGEHYADILLSLYQRQLKELHEEQEADRAEAEAVKEAAQAGKMYVMGMARSPTGRSCLGIPHKRPAAAGAGRARRFRSYRP